jgi:hypothetical protein
MAIPFPGKDVPLIDQETGMMNQTWYDYLKFHQTLAQLPDVSTTAPTNGQVLIYTAATKLWTPGAN